jgi:hypothetical protein
MALLIQRFDLTMDDPSYTLQIKSTLTVKPTNFKIRARVRQHREHLPLVPSNFAVSSERKINIVEKPLETAATSAPHIYVYYGSNSGSAETFAQRIASAAPSKGKVWSNIQIAQVDKTFFQASTLLSIAWMPLPGVCPQMDLWSSSHLPTKVGEHLPLLGPVRSLTRLFLHKVNPRTMQVTSCTGLPN